MNANTWINNRDVEPGRGKQSRNFTPKPQLDQRDIGYTIGGPVWIPKLFNRRIKSKVFFFFSQEHQKRSDPARRARIA